ncbi:hypothetical protein LguiA_021246 [Lonicera macranthoides]
MIKITPLEFLSHHECVKLLVPLSRRLLQPIQGLLQFTNTIFLANNLEPLRLRYINLLL